MKQKIYVEIAGVRLGIISEDGEEYVSEIAKKIDEKVKKMISSQRNCSLVEASLFCAMDSYSAAESDAKKIKNLEAQIALYQTNMTILKRENEQLRSRLLK